MNYSDYQQRIKEFAVYPRIGNNLSYPVLGLISEFGDELLTKLGEFESGFCLITEAEEESGDCFWYFGTIYNEIDENWSKVLKENDAFYKDSCKEIDSIIDSQPEIVIGGLPVMFGVLSGFAAKADRDNNGKLLEEHRDDFVDTLLVLQATLVSILKKYKISIKDVLTNNLSKLQSRKERNVLHGDGDNR